MRNTFYVLALGLLFITGFTSCSKDKTPGVKTKMEYLTSKKWIYFEYFTNYNSAGTILAYKLGKGNNTMNLSQNWITYNADGTYQEKSESGQIYSGTWKFLNNESQTQVTNSTGVYTSTIILLDDKQYEWYDPVSGRYGKLIPSN